MKLKAIVSIAALSLVLTSCENLFMHDRAGEAVSFGASAGNGGILTKTAYSGYVYDGKERIDWEEGDNVRVFMYTHNQNNRWGSSSVTYKDYSVVNIQDQDERSVGQLSAEGEKLVWSENLIHDFYSFYPSSFFGYDLAMEYGYFWGNYSPVRFTLPSEQEGETSGSNMEYLYMAAVAEGFPSAGRGSVVLEYYPMVTTLHFTLRNNLSTHEAVTIQTAKLRSTDNTTLSGTFTASISGGKFVPSADNSSDGSTAITIDMSTSVQYGESADFVFFLLPRSSYDPAKLKFVLSTSKGVSSISLANTQVSAFNSCDKYNLILDIDENAHIIQVTQASQILFALSDSPYLDQVEFRYGGGSYPNGLYYKQPSWPPHAVEEDELPAMFATVTAIDNNSAYLTELLPTLSPEDFTCFPNLKNIHLTQLGNTQAISVENLNNLMEVFFSSNAEHITISNCSFDASNDIPLKVYASRWTDVDIENVTGLEEIQLIAGNEQGGGGNIGDVNIHDCPDLKVIKVLRNSSAQVAMKTASFSNLPSVETIYLDQVNATNSISISNCDLLSRVIVTNQTNWLLQTISLSNLPSLGDSAPDASEYGLTGFNVDKVAMNITATKVNCPLLGSGFVTHQSMGDGSPVTIPFN